MSATAVAKALIERIEHMSSFIGVTVHAPVAGVNPDANDSMLRAHESWSGHAMTTLEPRPWRALVT